MSSTDSVPRLLVTAEWDADAEVWVAQSSDVVGLVTEASTVEALEEKLRVLIPELLELNGSPSRTPGPVAFELVAHRLGIAGAA